MKKTLHSSNSKLALVLMLSFMVLPAIKAQSQTVYYDTIKKQKYLLVDVHSTYEKVLSKGYESVEMLEYLGNFYFKCADFKKSKIYFDRLFKKYKVSQISSSSIEQYETMASCIVR
jgi:hypothetical protein